MKLNWQPEEHFDLRLNYIQGHTDHEHIHSWGAIQYDTVHDFNLVHGQAQYMGPAELHYNVDLYQWRAESDLYNLNPSSFVAFPPPVPLLSACQKLCA